MSNEQMKAKRFLRWHIARKKLAFIREHATAGHTVTLSTSMLRTPIKAKHLDSVKATKNGLYIQRGKSWINYDGAQISVVS